MPGVNVEPDAGEQGAESEPETVSVADAEPYVTDVPPGFPVVTVFGKSPGGVTAGSVVSRTVTLKDPAGVPSSSFVQSTEVVVIGNCVPEAGAHVTPGSVAYDTIAPAELVASTVMSLGTERKKRADAGVANASTSASSAMRPLTLTPQSRMPGSY